MFTKLEQEQNLNTPGWVDDVIQALADRGIAVTTRPLAPGGLGDKGVDALWELRRGKTEHAYEALFVTHPTARILARATDSARTLLLAPHLTRHQAETCRRLGVQFADAAGNMLLSWDDVLIDIQGRARPSVALPGKPAISTRTFTPAGIKIVLSLLSFPGLAAEPMRTIAQVSTTSLGAVSKVLTDLAASGFLDSRDRSLHRTHELLDDWTAAYLLEHRRHKPLGSYSVTDPEDLLMKPQPPRTRWGGEAAAAIVDPQLRPAGLLLYAEELPTNHLAAWKVRRAATEPPNLTIHRAFWSLERGDGPTPGRLAPSPLIHADLLAAGDARLLQAAKHFRRQDDLLRALDAR